LIVNVARRADAELASAIAFLRRSNPRAANALGLAIERALNSLESFPRRGRPGSIDGTRELVVRRTSYVIVYSVTDEVFVARVRHTSQDPAP
jgi:toxin ParE1/3/4